MGINTVLKDDPSLTARVPGGRDPLRIVLDSRLRIPLTAKVLVQRSPARTIIAALAGAPKTKVAKVRAAGAEVLFVKSDKGRVDLHDLMRQLGKWDIMSILLEGGAEVHAAALKAGIVDKVVLFIAPMLMTGKDSLGSIGGPSPVRLRHALRLHGVTARFIGRDIMVEAYLR